MPTCKQIAERSGFSYKEITAAASALGHPLRRGKGHTFDASATEAQAIEEKARQIRKDRDAAREAGRKDER